MAKKTSMISIRLKKDDFFWIKNKGISPTQILDDAINKLKKRIKK